jgi:hypothetical protein
LETRRPAISTPALRPALSPSISRDPKLPAPQRATSLTTRRIGVFFASEAVAPKGPRIIATNRPPRVAALCSLRKTRAAFRAQALEAAVLDYFNDTGVGSGSSFACYRSPRLRGVSRLSRVVPLKPFYRQPAEVSPASATDATQGNHHPALGFPPPITSDRLSPANRSTVVRRLLVVD